MQKSAIQVDVFYEIKIINWERPTSRPPPPQHTYTRDLTKHNKSFNWLQ